MVIQAGLSFVSDIGELTTLRHWITDIVKKNKQRSALRKAVLAKPFGQLSAAQATAEVFGEKVPVFIPPSLYLLRM